MFRKTIDNDFPDFMEKIKKVDSQDARLNSALLRDYQILAAGYMLEPCHLSYLKTNYYGEGSDFIPENIAIPLKFLSDRLGSQQPILDYAHGYALGNWQFVDDKNPENISYSNDMIAPNKELPLSNLKLVREIIGGKDEAGFILIHVAIVAESYRQVRAYEKIFSGVKSGNR